MGSIFGSTKINFMLENNIFRIYSEILDVLRGEFLGFGCPNAALLAIIHGNYIEMRKINYMLEIDILGNYSQNNLGVLKDDF